MLSNNADKLLEYLLSLPSSDGHVYAETPTDITRSDTCYELQQKGYIDRYQAFGHSGFSCILTYMAKEYSKNKGMYQYMEAKNMFTPLSKSSRAFFLELVDNRDKLSQYLDTL